MNTRKYARLFKKQGADPTLIQRVIDAHKMDKTLRSMLYDRYQAKQDAVPVLTRNPVSMKDFETDRMRRIDDKINNRINNPYDVLIIDTKVGYLYGNPIAYEVGEEEGRDFTALKKAIDDFNMRNSVADKDAELGKKATICGYGARLAFIDKDGNERIINIDPWEAIIISGTDYTEPEFAIRYFPKDDDENDLFVEFYDGVYIYEFETGENGLQEIGSQEHTFDHCPLMGLPNNDELMSDVQRVFAMINAVDYIMSDAVNEIEQYRLAYLVLTGMTADAEDMEQIRQTGIFELMEGDKVEYLTKNINDNLIENTLNRLERNILKLAKSVDFTDEKFANVASGRAMEFRLSSLEDKCITMERKNTSMLRYQYKVLCSAWHKKGICELEDYLKVWFGFKRNLPVDKKEEVETAVAMLPLTSHKTALSTVSFIDNAEYEIQQRELERDEFTDIDDETSKDDE